MKDRQARDRISNLNSIIDQLLTDRLTCSTKLTKLEKRIEMLEKRLGIEYIEYPPPFYEELKRNK